MDEHKDHLDLLIKQVFTGMKKIKSQPAMCPDDEMLAAYLEDSLTDEEREKVEEHLGSCKDCVENIITLSEAESSYDSLEKHFLTNEMVKKAKNLMESAQETSALWERISYWFTIFRPVPVMVAVSVILAVGVFGIFYQYTPSVPPLETSPFIRFSIININSFLF